jgi:hypothetical protein
MKVVSSTALGEFYDIDLDPGPVTSLAYAVVESEYGTETLARIASKALELRPRAQGKFLGLVHLRAAQTHIPEVFNLMHDLARLRALSVLCGTELEPYPLTRAGAHINFYEPHRATVDFHTDGPPYVELIPILLDGNCRGGSTVIFRGCPQSGLAIQRKGQKIPRDRLLSVSHEIGRSIVMQGRSLCHSAEVLTDGQRVTLVLPLRSKLKPWKDNNTLERLLLDDSPEDVVDEWTRDSIHRKLPALRSAGTDRD